MKWKKKIQRAKTKEGKSRRSLGKYEKLKKITNNGRWSPEKGSGIQKWSCVAKDNEKIKTNENDHVTVVTFANSDSYATVSILSTVC